MKKIVQIIFILILAISTSCCFSPKEQQQNIKRTKSNGEIVTDITCIDKNLVNDSIFISKRSQQCPLDTLLERLAFGSDLYVSQTLFYNCDTGEYSSSANGLPNCIANAIKKSRYTGYVFYMKFAILYNGKYQRHLNIYAYLKNSEYYVFFAYGDVENKNNV